MISLFHPSVSNTVYHHAERWGDGRDPMNYNMTYETEKTFSEQF